MNQEIVVRNRENSHCIGSSKKLYSVFYTITYLLDTDEQLDLAAECFNPVLRVTEFKNEHYPNLSFATYDPIIILEQIDIL